MASYDPSDYDSVYSEEEFMDVVQGATTPPLMNYDEFLAKTMGESWIAVFLLYYIYLLQDKVCMYVYMGYTYILLVQCHTYLHTYISIPLPTHVLEHVYTCFAYLMFVMALNFDKMPLRRNFCIRCRAHYLKIYTEHFSLYIY